MAYENLDEEDIREVQPNRKPLFIGLGVLVVFVIVGAVAFLMVAEFTGDEEPAFWQGEPSQYKQAAVAAESPKCSTMGKDILQKGGNAVEAAITTDICIGIMHCFATNVGGGGVMLIRSPNGDVEVLDYREAAPGAATYDMYSANNWSSLYGPLASGVPGSFKGYSEAFKKYGSGAVTWAELITPVAELAANFEVDSLLAKRLVDYQEWVFEDPGLSSVFAPDGVLLGSGDECKWPALSKTLTEIASDPSVDVFYNGEIGERLIQDMLEIDDRTMMTTEDLSNYQPIYREPLASFYRGYQVFGAPPPFTGGAIIAQGLNVIEQYNFPYMEDSALTQHYLIQSMLFGYSDRTGMGDPMNPTNANMTQDLIDVMLTKQHAADIRTRISPDTTYPVDHYIDLADPADQKEDHGTSHFSVMDNNGYTVGCTSTVNWGFGAKYMSPSTGLIMNNEMDDFSTPGKPNGFGFPPSASNYPCPGCRPASSMSPTIITKNDQVYFVGGGSGGSRIISATYQTIVNFMDFGWNVFDAVNRPRIHDQWIPYFLEVEQGYSGAWKDEFKENFGYNVTWAESFAVVQSIARQDDGTLQAACDRRKNGIPDGF